MVGKISMSLDLRQGFKLGTWIIKPLRGEISGGRTEPRHLEPKAMDVLVQLAEHSNEAVSRETLLQAVWPGQHAADELLTGAISKLRHALHDDADSQSLIQTIPKRGYRLIGTICPVTQNASATSERSLRRFAVDRLSRPAILLLIGATLVAVLLYESIDPATQQTAAVDQESVKDRGTVERQLTIAVLPFANLSNEPDTEYFSDGLSDIVRVRLAQVMGLTVIARISSLQFLNSDRDVRDIARALGAAYILEGSVQKSGDSLRVAAQLIDARTGAQMNAMTFDRQLADVFRIQDEIAQHVSTELQISLLGDGKMEITQAYTTSVEAFEHYLRGRQIVANVSNRSAMLDAMEDYRAAIAIDPDFVNAYVAEAVTWMYLVDVGGAGITESTSAVSALQSEIATRRPNHPDLDLIKAWLAWMGRDKSEAERRFAKYIAGKVASGDGYYLYAYYLQNQLRFPDSIAVARRGQVLDPLNGMLEQVIAWAETGLGQHEQSRGRLLRLIEHHPDFVDAVATMGADSYYSFGMLHEAIHWHDKLCQLIPDGRPPYWCSCEEYMQLQGWDIADKYYAGDAELTDPYERQYGVLYRLERGTQADAVELALASLLDERQRWNSLTVFSRMSQHEPGVTPELLRKRYERAFPSLLNGPGLDAQVFNWSIGRSPRVHAMAEADYASILLRTGEMELAARYLDDVDTFIAKTDRMGWWGDGILDAEVAAIRDRKSAALDALEAAFNAGWMEDWWFNFHYNPNLMTLHDEPRFDDLQARLEQRAATQLALARDADTYRIR
jgi:TolB-like protein/DNA-binding winged helix-turn-helix (wHTH) protein